MYKKALPVLLAAALFGCEDAPKDSGLDAVNPVDEVQPVPPSSVDNVYAVSYTRDWSCTDGTSRSDTGFSLMNIIHSGSLFESYPLGTIGSYDRFSRVPLHNGAFDHKPVDQFFVYHDTHIFQKSSTVGTLRNNHYTATNTVRLTYQTLDGDQVCEEITHVQGFGLYAPWSRQERLQLSGEYVVTSIDENDTPIGNPEIIDVIDSFESLDIYAFQTHFLDVVPDEQGFISAVVEGTFTQTLAGVIMPNSLELTHVVEVAEPHVNVVSGVPRFAPHTATNALSLFGAYETSLTRFDDMCDNSSESIYDSVHILPAADIDSQNASRVGIWIGDTHTIPYFKIGESQKAGDHLYVEYSTADENYTYDHVLDAVSSYWGLQGTLFTTRHSAAGSCTYKQFLSGFKRYGVQQIAGKAADFAVDSAERGETLFDYFFSKTP